MSNCYYEVIYFTPEQDAKVEKFERKTEAAACARKVSKKPNKRVQIFKSTITDDCIDSIHVAYYKCGKKID